MVAIIGGDVWPNGHRLIKHNLNVIALAGRGGIIWPLEGVIIRSAKADCNHPCLLYGEVHSENRQAKTVPQLWEASAMK